MGFKTEFNWILKLKPEQGLDENNLTQGEEYQFNKDGNRVYPSGIPVDLVNNNWEAVARVLVLRFTNSVGKTSGVYKLLKIYAGEEKRVLTNYWRETVEVMKGEKFSDFSNVKAS